ncbi:sensor domain-containing diguanylate cyclase [Cohnella caldifontis]|uniref:sensor domain-containing diguanylate cyclase n=1 Tax=Cohnella caldifontis TaxID=3027471 RepID=UPI0023EDF71B|nr:sensor domain-containing diguanylate cyclase [Cohnella sp. YIM B05605]
MQTSDIQEMFKFLSEKSQNIISSFSADGVFTYVSPTVTALLGYRPEEVIGKPATAFNHPDDNMLLGKFRDSAVTDQGTLRFTGRVRHKNGEYRWYETTVEYIRDPYGDIVQKIGVGRDITDRKIAEETISHLAYHDALTGLPNRRSFGSRADRHLEESGARHGLMLLDLDGFKSVNDTYGHQVGDLLLAEAANRLKRTVEDKGFAARWGGDEFTVFRAAVENRAELDSLAARIRDAISEPYRVAGQTLRVTACIGVSLFPEDGESLEALIRNADAGMYRAKNETKNRL